MKKSKYGQKKKPTTIAKWFGRITIKKKLIITAAVFLGLMGTSISLQLISSSNTSVNISEDAGAMMKENSQKNVEENLKRLTFNIAQFVVSMETELGKNMLNAAYLLQELDSDGDLSTSDLEKLKNQTGMSDLYITDQNGIFIKSTEKQAIGLSLFDIWDGYRMLITGEADILTSPLKLKTETGEIFKFIAIPRKGATGIIESALNAETIEQMLIPLMQEHTEIKALYLVDSEGLVLTETLQGDQASLWERGQNAINQFFEKASSTAEAGIYFEDENEVAEIYYPITVDGTTNYVIYVLVDTTDYFTSANIAKEAMDSIITNQNTSLNFTIIASILLTIILLVLFSFVIHFSFKPLNKLTATAKKIAEGDLTVQIEGNVDNELGILLDAFSQVAERLHGYINYIEEISSVLNQISRGDLTYHLRLHYIGEFVKLKYSLENIRSSMSQTLLIINTSAQQVSAGAVQVSIDAQTLASGSTEQAATIKELSASIAQVAEQAHANLEHVKFAAEYTKQANDSINIGNIRMKELSKAMNNINTASNQIASITKTIEDIAFQTNILALNAAVEAARAGNAGKGFAVVADEVRNLASKSTEAAKQTSELIEHSVAVTAEGTRITEQTAQVLQDVQNKATAVNENILKIEQASIEQTNSIVEIQNGLGQVSSVVQMNAASAEENSATSEEMSAQAITLLEEVGRFKLSSEYETGRITEHTKD